MITLGLILFIVGLVASVSILQTLGLVLLVLGVILAILGGTGRSVGGRRHYW